MKHILEQILEHVLINYIITNMLYYSTFYTSAPSESTVFAHNYGKQKKQGDGPPAQSVKNVGFSLKQAFAFSFDFLRFGFLYGLTSAT